MTATCCSFSRRMMRKIIFASCSVSAAVGSSITRTRAWPASARAISTIRCSATESRLTSASGSIEEKPSWSRRARDRSRMVRSSTIAKPAPRRSGRSASEIFSATVMSPITDISCGSRRTPAVTAARGSAKTLVLAIDPHRPRVARIDAGQDLHQRRLARPVRAEQRQHLAGRDDEIDIVQHRTPPKDLPIPRISRRGGEAGGVSVLDTGAPLAREGTPAR